MAGLVRKDAEVAGRRRLQPEREIIATHPPAWRDGPRKSPFPAFRVIWLNELAVGGAPGFFRERWPPVGLRFGPHQSDFAEALEFASGTTVQKLVIVPCGG